MLAHERFEKRGKVACAKSYLRPSREIEGFGVVNSHGHPSLPTAEIPADVAGQSEPSVKVISNAGARSPRIRFQRAVDREDPAGKQAMHMCAGIDKGVSAGKFPFGSRLILCCSKRGKRTQGNNR
jgi:hypothetical protein